MDPFRILCWPLIALGLAGCGAPAEPTLFPARGTVSFRGKAVPRAELTFHPQFEGPGWMPVGTVGDDGAFAVSTKLPGDGALPGSYKVTIVWRPGAAEDETAPNLLPRRYADPKTTPLVVELGPSSPQLPPIELKE
jgi:hypothetical protein